jgi:hypothetical protein
MVDDEVAGLPVGHAWDERRGVGGRVIESYGECRTGQRLDAGDLAEDVEHPAGRFADFVALVRHGFPDRSSCRAVPGRGRTAAGGGRRYGC